MTSGCLQCERRRLLDLAFPSVAYPPSQHCSLHCHHWRMTWPGSLCGLFLVSETPCVSLMLSFSACFTYHFKYNGLELPINTDKENALNKLSVDIIIFYNKILLALSQIRKLHAAPFAIFTWNDKIILSWIQSSLCPWILLFGKQENWCAYSSVPDTTMVKV